MCGIVVIGEQHFGAFLGSTACPSCIRHCREPWIHQEHSGSVCFLLIWLLGSADLLRHSPSIAVCMIDIDTDILHRLLFV